MSGLFIFSVSKLGLYRLSTVYIFVNLKAIAYVFFVFYLVCDITWLLLFFFLVGLVVF